MDFKTYPIADEKNQAAQRKFMLNVFSWMTLALMLTGVSAFLTVSSESLIMALVTNRLLFYGLIILQFVAVGYLSVRVSRMSTSLAIAVFLAYAMLNGLTLSLILLVYTMSSIISTFFICAATFGVMSLFGYLTKSDLTGIGRMFGMLLVGLVIASVVNIFLQSSMVYWITSYLGVAIFVGLIAYDTQKIKTLYFEASQQGKSPQNIAILGALTLYLDFVNLFIFLLRFFGARRD
jgi:uncharacterized protein